MSLYDDLPPVGSAADDIVPEDISKKRDDSSDNPTPDQNTSNTSGTSNSSSNNKPKFSSVTVDILKRAPMLQNAINRKQQESVKKKPTATRSSLPKKEVFSEVIETKILDQVTAPQTSQQNFVGIIGNQVDDPYDPMKPNDYEDILDERVGKIPHDEKVKKVKVEASYKKNENVQGMMSRMGYQEGYGLGKANQGRVAPLTLNSKTGEIR